MASSPAKSSVGSTLPSVKYPILVAIIHQISEGVTPSEACNRNGTTLAALRYHISKDEEIEALFKDAMDVGNDALADQLVDIDKLHSNPAMASVISKNIQWLLERRASGKYGARVQVSMENNATKEFLAVLDKAMDRIPTASVPQVPQITDASYEIVEPEKKRPAPTPTAPASSPTPDIETLKSLGLA